MQYSHMVMLSVFGFAVIALFSFGWRRITMGLPPIGGAKTNSIVLNLQHPGNPDRPQPQLFNRPPQKPAH